MESTVIDAIQNISDITLLMTFVKQKLRKTFSCLFCIRAVNLQALGLL